MDETTEILLCLAVLFIKVNLNVFILFLDKLIQYSLYKNPEDVCEISKLDNL